MTKINSIFDDSLLKVRPTLKYCTLSLNSWLNHCKIPSRSVVFTCSL